MSKQPRKNDSVKSSTDTKQNQFAIYYNKNNPHVMIHKIPCGHIEKHGGKHNYCQGGWKYFAAEPDAKRYANKISNERNLPLKHCTSCYSLPRST